MSTVKANQIIGHSNTATESAYIYTEVRDCFARAEPDLLLNGNGQIKAVKAELSQQGQTIETLVKLLGQRLGDSTIKSDVGRSTANTARNA